MVPIKHVMNLANEFAESQIATSGILRSFEISHDEERITLVAVHSLYVI